MKKTTVKKPSVQKKKSVKKKVHKREFLRVYWPYIPLFLLVVLGLTNGYQWQTTFGEKYNHLGHVLAYATEMSSSGLLKATNDQRSQNGGLVPLTLNNKLASAAQAKANDMVARNYWSHTTPDGQDPWIFIDATGYSYQKAGENLAYGFATSWDTVIGWMNSPTHRANVLGSAYREVGFGFANAGMFVGTGEQTIVVAMYATPVEVATVTTTQQPAAAPAPAAAPIPAKSAPASPTKQPTPQNTDVEQPSTETPPDTAEATETAIANTDQPTTTDTPIPASQPVTRITRLQMLTSGKAPWSAAALSVVLVAVVGLWVAKHAYTVKKVLIDGESFIMHHPLLDVGVLIIVAVAILLSQSSGVIL